MISMIPSSPSKSSRQWQSLGFPGVFGQAEKELLVVSATLRTSSGSGGSWRQGTFKQSMARALNTSVGSRQGHASVSGGSDTWTLKSSKLKSVQWSPCLMHNGERGGAMYEEMLLKEWFSMAVGAVRMGECDRFTVGHLLFELRLPSGFMTPPLPPMEKLKGRFKF